MKTLLARGLRRALFALLVVGVAGAAHFLLGLLAPAQAQQVGGSLSDLIEGSGNATSTGATTIIAAVSPSSLRMYITSVQCGRTDAGTSAIFVTFNDTASTILVLPNSGGGSEVTAHFGSPLIVAANTAFKFTASSGVSTLYCSAQGHAAN